jgi:hypothetical protein
MLLQRLIQLPRPVDLIDDLWQSLVACRRNALDDRVLLELLNQLRPLSTHLPLVPFLLILIAVDLGILQR